MTLSDWDGTPWAGTVAPADLHPLPIGRPDGMATAVKAVVGSGVGFYGPNTVSIASVTRSPQAFMKQAQIAYHTNPWVQSAESAVTRKVKGLPWHLEDENAEEYDRDKALPPSVRLAYDLLEKPLGRLLLEQRLPSPVTTYDRMIGILSRHVGLCGMGYLYLDQMDIDRIPLNLLYVNPARMWDAKDPRGNLTGWVLDPKDTEGNGGTPLELAEVIPFYLEAPDWGHIGSGKYEAAVLKASITNLADQHASYVLATGGRIAGIVTPKAGGSIPDDKFQEMLQNFRNLNEAPDAAKRTAVMQQPIDFIKTAGDPSELDLIELSKMNRDDILAIWGVPPTQAAIPQAGGLNSGETKGYDEAILMQGPVHDRVKSIRETLQYLLFDRWQATGITVTLVIDEPEFDDETPRYDMAAKAAVLPLKNIERRELTGHPPFGDDRDEEVWLPSTYAVAYEATGKAPEPPPQLASFAGTNQPVLPFPDGTPVKAGRREFLGLRKSLDTRWVPATHKKVSLALEAQRSEVAAKIRSASPKTLKDNVNRPEFWFATKREDDRLANALRPGAMGIAETVTERIGEMLAGKAGFSDSVASVIRALIGRRVAGINSTTRQAIAEAVATGVAQGLSPSQVGDLIEGLPAFDGARAELVARTETMTAYNSAAIASYREYGVEQVEAIDGDEDPECAARDGRTYSIEEASSIEDHPNGTLDWAPVAAKAESVPAPVRGKVRMTPVAGGGWDLEEIA